MVKMVNAGWGKVENFFGYAVGQVLGNGLYYVRNGVILLMIKDELRGNIILHFFEKKACGLLKYVFYCSL